MNASARNAAVDLEQIAHLKHEMLTTVNHILGLTELQIDEAAESGLREYVPALTEINTSGRTLLGIIDGELAAFSGTYDLGHLDARIASEAEPALVEARKLTERLRAAGNHEAAVELDLVSSALVNLIAISHATVQEQVRK